MPAYRFFYEGSLQSGSAIILQEKEHHHLLHVMRRAVGDKVEVVNGMGELASALVTAINRHEALLSLENVFKSHLPPNELILAQAVPKMNRLETILEKGTELGMTELWLFPGETSGKGLLQPKIIEKMKGVMIAAMKQCGRLYLPRITLMPSISQWKDIEGALLFGDLDPNAPLLFDALKKKREKKTIFVVGPEAGFTEDEVKALKSLGGCGVKLHENILRTDTASITALSLIHHYDILQGNKGF